MMDSSSALLTYIHQNAEMGRDTIKQLMGVTQDPGFEFLLQSQYREYTAINNISEKKLRARKTAIKDTGPLAKAAAYASIGLNTLTNKDPSHISEMLIRGSTTGVIDITKKINAHSMTADIDVLDLANGLLSFEQRNIDECKKYLQ